MSDDDLYLGPTALGPSPREPNELADRLARWLVLPLTLAVLVIVLVFYIFFSSAVVNGDSMAPTLADGDYLLVTHGDGNLHRGDIIVTRVQEDTGPVELVKRVIALPGDTVEIRADVAIVNGVPEPNRGQFVIPRLGVYRSAITIPPGEVYVMGDNRPISEDSRYIGAVPLAGVKGRAVFVFAPITHVKRI